MSGIGRLVLVGCGGTIAASSRSGSFVPTADLVAAYGLEAHVPLGAEVVPVEFDTRSSTEWSVADALSLVRAIERHDQSPDVIGTVITFGTGTLEETAYLAQLILSPRRPVVFTAAVAPIGHTHSDGGGNLRDALLVAASDMPPGVYVVVQGEVHDPGEFTKVHSSRIQAFASPEFGALARVEDGLVRRFRMLVTRGTLTASRLDARVELIKCYQGMGELLIRHLEPSVVDGLVVESLASGQVPPPLAAALGRLQRSGVQVVLSTRCLMGRLRVRERFPVPFVGDELQLMSEGCLCAFESGVKARIRLQVGLSTGLTNERLRRWIETGW